MYADPQQTEPEAVQEKWNTSWNYYRLIDRFVVKGDQWGLQLGAYWNYRQQTQLQEYEADTRLGTDRYYWMISEQALISSPPRICSRPKIVS